MLVHARPASFPEIDALAKRWAIPAELGLPHPYFVVHDGSRGATTRVAGAELLDFAGSDYLGLAADPAVAAAAKAAIDRYGTSVAASRVASGERPIHRELEDALAAHLGTQAALAFVSAHATNVTVLGHVLSPADLIVYDAHAHDSIVQGARLAGAQRRVFRHNDLGALDRILSKATGKYRRVLVAVEGVYSMDGDIAPLPGLIELRDLHRVLLYVDDAHGIGVLGSSGRGLAEHWGVDPATVDLWITLSKALASAGGYVAGSSELVTYLRYSAPGFVYSTGLAPSAAAAALAALERLGAEPGRAAIAPARASLFRRLARAAGLDTGRSEEGTAIVPVMVGDTVTALQLADRLWQAGIGASPIVYPAVREGKARLRFMCNAHHTEADIRHAVAQLAALTS
ncbi:MAG TPA: aminotransferase class I/II-fold pyridoxal phosphate-dependent enzyme [Natronosporangium sp.]